VIKAKNKNNYDRQLGLRSQAILAKSVPAHRLWIVMLLFSFNNWWQNELDANLKKVVFIFFQHSYWIC